MCVGSFVLELRWKIPECEQAGYFRTTQDGSFSVFSGEVAVFDDAGYLEVVQQDGAHKREESAERMVPFVVPCHEAQRQVSQQGSPYLPAHGVFIVA